MLLYKLGCDYYFSENVVGYIHLYLSWDHVFLIYNNISVAYQKYYFKYRNNCSHRSQKDHANKYGKHIIKCCI